jgi:colanic acid/amylovoran biosynthesis glycosyltransferase
VRSAVLRVLMYHRVVEPSAAIGDNPSIISATPRGFHRQVRHLAGHYRVVSAEQVLDAVRHDRPLPRRAVLLTFDDGYRDFGEIAWPILRRYGMPATLFVATAYPGSERAFWWDRLARAFTFTERQVLERAPVGRLSLRTPAERLASSRTWIKCLETLPHEQAMLLLDELCCELGSETSVGGKVLTWQELRQLAADGLTVGAHTQTHPALTRLPLDAARSEIRGCRQDLLREMGVLTPVFSYPFGYHDDRIVEIVRQEGFELGFTCVPGFNRIPIADSLRFQRTNITVRTTPFIFGVRLTSSGDYLDRWRLAGNERRTRGAVTKALTPSAALEKNGSELVVTAEAGVHGSGEQNPFSGKRLGIIVSRFPKLTETFILSELRELQRLGIGIELFPLLRHREGVVQPDVEELITSAHYRPYLSPRLWRDNLHYVLHRPLCYVRAFTEVVRGSWRSPRYLVGAVGYFPKAASFARVAEQKRVRHVHAQFANHPAVAALVIHRLTGIRFSFTARGSDIHVDRTMLADKIAAAQFAIAVSEANKEVMVRASGAAAARKIRVVYGGIDTDLFSPAPADPAGGSFRIVCIGRFEEVKGHAQLVAACAVLAEHGLQFTCDLIGDGELRSELEREIARLGLRDRIVLHGNRQQREIVHALRSAHVCVLATVQAANGKREGIPNVLKEAMACAVPVVSSRISGIPELVDDGVTGILVPPAQPQALAGALIRLANDPGLREKMGRAGRTRIEADFDLRASARRRAELYFGIHASAAGAARARAGNIGAPVVAARDGRAAARIRPCPANRPC